LIVSTQTAKAISQGRVTQHRHPGAPLKTGHDYPVQPGQGKPALCRIHVLTVLQMPAGHVTFHDARREGYKTTLDLKAAFIRRHDARWVLAQAEDPDEKACVERFDAVHANRLVQVITFKLVVDEPRFLASQYKILHGHTDRGEYTARRGQAIDELEVVDEQTVERFAKAAELFGLEQRDRFRNQHAERRQRKRNARLEMFRKGRAA
jgi:hypothetical protein